MKVRAVGQLQAYLDRSILWRKRELTSLKFTIGTARPTDQPTLLRAALGLLYAHWEGFVRDSAEAYLRHASEQALRLAELRPHFKALALAGRLRECSSPASLAARRRFFEFIEGSGDQRVKVPWKGVVRTGWNLKGEPLRELVDGLGLDFTPFALKTKPVIDRLVDRRNEVAHGRGAPVTAEEYQLLHSEIIGLLEQFKTQLEFAAQGRSFAA